MKHIHTFESFINEGIELVSMSDAGVSNFNKKDTTKKHSDIEAVLLDPETWTDDLSFKDKQGNVYFIDDLLNKDVKIGGKIIKVEEGELYDVKKKVKAGKMHKLLGVPEDKEITDVYTDPKKLAEDLVKATGDKKEATGMLAFAANINPANNIFDKALKAMPEVK